MSRKILIINDRLHAGGVEKVLQSLCACLADRGDAITIWAYEGDMKTLGEKYPPGLKYRKLPFWDGDCRRFTPKWFFNRACRVLFEGFLLKLKRWDVVIAFKEGPSMRLAAKLRAGKKLAWIHTDYSSLHWSRHSFHSDGDELMCMQRFDSVVCVSQACADGLVSTIGDPGNLCIRYSPINPQAIAQAAALVPEDCVRDTGKPLFVSVGRLSEVKRYDMLIDICGQLEKQFDFQLWIVGGGELEDELRRRLQERKIQSVRLLGMRENPYPYMAAADCFVSASASESYAIVVQEALITGTPVIAAACPAIEETLESRFGMLTGLDQDSLLAGMAEILSHPQLLRQYRENISRFYDKSGLWDGRIQDICSLLDNN